MTATIRTAASTVAAFRNASDACFMAVADLRSIQGEALSTLVADLERIANVLADRAKTVSPVLAASTEPAKHRQPTVPVTTVTSAPVAVPAPVVTVPVTSTVGPLTSESEAAVKGRELRTLAKSLGLATGGVNEVLEARIAAAQSGKPTVAAHTATPPAPVAPKADAPKGLPAYKAMQARAKALGVSASGTMERLTDRVVKAEAAKVNGPKAPTVPTATTVTTVVTTPVTMATMQVPADKVVLLAKLSLLSPETLAHLLALASK